MAVLRVFLSQPNPFGSQGEIFERAGIRSGSQQSRIKKQLISHRLIVDHRLRTGKSVTVFWEPTETAYRATGIQNHSISSNGGFLHKLAAFYICEWARCRGYQAEIEFQLPNGKLLDVFLRKNSEVIFVEIGISKPLAKEITNLEKDLQSGLEPSRIIIAVQDTKDRQSIETEIERSESLMFLKKTIEAMLIGDFIRTARKTA